MSSYDDIINLPHPEPKCHKRMSPISRAAQFGAFRALTGHEEAIAETARLTENEVFADDNVIEKINERLVFLSENIEEKYCVTITYFEPDELKDGGEYIKYVGYIKKINQYERMIVTDDDTEIKIDCISNLNGDIFDTCELIL